MLIDGKALAQEILDGLKNRVKKLQLEKNITPCLDIILVGTDPASEAYVRQKVKMAQNIHSDVTVYKYPENISQKELLYNIDFLQKNTELHGLIIQLPLPDQLNDDILLENVKNNKDVDGFKKDSAFEEPLAKAVIYILEYIFSLEQKSRKENPPGRWPTEPKRSQDSFRGDGGVTNNFLKWLRSKNIVIIGKGKTGGMPIIQAFRKKGIGYSIIDTKTNNPAELIGQADILVCAAGREVLVHEGIIKKDAILIGIGMHKGEDGKIHGDYNNEDVKDKTKYYTPIPGGVGPVNAAMLLANVVESAERQ